MKAATVALFLFAAFLLTSLGGAAVLFAPITLPAIYGGLRRHPTLPFRLAGAFVASLTVLEVVFVGVYMLAGDGGPWFAVGLPASAAAFAAFFVVPKRAQL